MAQLAINPKTLAEPAGLSAGAATVPDGLRQLLSGDDRRFSCGATGVNPSAFNGQRPIFTQWHERHPDDASSAAGRSDRRGPATTSIAAVPTDPAGHFMVAPIPFCGAEPQPQSASRNSRPGQGAAVVVLVTTTAVLQRRQHFARAITGSSNFNAVLTETHHG
jgi:hypothetical protein